MIQSCEEQREEMQPFLITHTTSSQIQTLTVLLHMCMIYSDDNINLQKLDFFNVMFQLCSSVCLFVVFTEAISVFFTEPILTI